MDLTLPVQYEDSLLLIQKGTMTHLPQEKSFPRGSQRTRCSEAGPRPGVPGFPTTRKSGLAMRFNYLLPVEYGGFITRYSFMAEWIGIN